MDNEKQHIGQLFDRIASSYDRLNHLLSLSIDRRWRRKAVSLLSDSPKDGLTSNSVSGLTVLDVAIGTADLTLEILRQHKASHVTGLDLSREMMRIGQNKAAKFGCSDKIRFDYGSALDMPYADASFDAVTCAYGVRNFSDMDKGLNEMYRVLRAGGELMILEFSYPDNRLVRWAYDLYFTHILPHVGNILSRDKGAYTYLNRSVRSFPYGDAFCRHLRQAGFTVLACRPLTFGITTVYHARKII